MRYMYLLRHGETQWNVERRMQGRMDSPLTELGKDQAGVHGALLKRLGGVERLWVSPSGRTSETAHIVNSHVHARIEYVDELVERDCGEWAGMTLDEVEDKYGHEWMQLHADPYWTAPPEGESLQDMLMRVNGFLDGLFDEQWSSIGLVTHGVMSRVVLKFFLNLDELECAGLRHPNDLLYRLTFDEQGIETHHYLDGGAAQSGLHRPVSVESATVISRDSE